MSEEWDKMLATFTDYRSITDWWNRYSIADSRGSACVKTLYRDTFEQAKKDYKLLTELVMILNHRLWYWHSLNPSNSMVSLYDMLWQKTHNYAIEELSDDEFSYYSSVTD